MITNLNDLLAKASTPSQSQMVKRTGEWVREDEHGNEIKESFEVFILRDIPFAAQERIYLGDEETPEAGSMCRGIAERLRFGEHGNERLTYKQAAELPSSLALSLFAVIAEYTAEQKKKADEKAKAEGEPAKQ